MFGMHRKRRRAREPAAHSSEMSPPKELDAASYRLALISSCAFFMVCSAGMLVFNKLVLRAIKLPITVSAPPQRSFLPLV